MLLVFKKMKQLKTIILFLLVFSTIVHGQEFDNLELNVPGNINIQKVFELHVSKSQAASILSSSGKKLKLRDPVLIFNHDTLKVSSVKTRGKTSLTFHRKSLSVTLKDPITIDGVVIKKFALLGLQMDKNYWRNRLSYLIMQQLDLFPLYSTFVEMRLNQETQGVYLFVRKSDDYIREIESPLLVRRVVNGNFEIDYQKGDEGKKLWKKFQKGRSLPSKFKEKELADTIKQVLDLKQYLRWLAFNFLIMNGDYADEVFFYYDPRIDRFKIIPWDYDDIFSSQPHEGWEQRKLTIDHTMLFSGEVYFDRVIDRDEYLYAEYLDEFKNLLSQIKPEDFRSIFQQVYSELYPFFIQPDLIGQSEYDAGGATSLENLQNDLKLHYEFLIRRYSTIQNVIFTR